MSVNYENYRDLTKAVQSMTPLSLFLTKTFFSKAMVSYTGNIVVAKNTAAGQGVAKFALADAVPQNVSALGEDAKIFSLPVTKEQMIFSINEFQNLKTVGNTIDGAGSDRLSAFNEYVLRNQKILRERTERRFEMLAASILETGKFEVTEDGVKHSLDFGFVDGTHYTALSGANLWSADTANPFQQLSGWIKDVQRKGGATVSHIIMGSSAAEYFLNQKLVKEKLNLLNYQVGTATPFAGGADIATGGWLIGRLPNGIPIYEYSQQYVDASGDTKEMFDPKKVMVISAQGQYQKVKGSIYRFKQDAIEVDTPMIEYYARIKTNEERTVGKFMLDWSAVPALLNPDTIKVIQVLT